MIIDLEWKWNINIIFFLLFPIHWNKLEGERYFGGPRKEMVRIGLSINGVLNILLDAIMST